MRLVADRHKVKVLHSWQGVVRTGNEPKMTSSGSLADWQRIWEDNFIIKHHKDIYKLLNALPHKCCWHPRGFLQEKLEYAHSCSKEWTSTMSKDLYSLEECNSGFLRNCTI